MRNVIPVDVGGKCLVLDFFLDRSSRWDDVRQGCRCGGALIHDFADGKEALPLMDY